MKLNPLLLSAAAALVLGGCATKMQRKLHGQPVANAVAAMGAPDSIIGLEDGRRIFQWVASDVQFVSDEDPYDRHPRWWTTNEGEPEGFFNKPCAVSITAHWDTQRRTWIVDRYRRSYPITCSMRPLPRVRPISYLKD